MLLTLGLSLVAVLAQAPQTDTTVDVRSGTRLEVHNLSGDVVIRAWNRNAVRVQAEHASRERVDLRIMGSVLRIDASARRGAPHGIDYTISMPAWMDVTVSGTYSDVSIEGAAGRINVETVQGDVRVSGGRGLVSLHSTQGDVTARGVTGRLEANSTNGEVTADSIEGELYAETVNGDIALRGIRSGNASAVTVNGDVTYRGTIQGSGRYSFSTHNGDIELTVPTGTNATVWVSTFSGEFESDFPFTLSGIRQGKRFNFTLGNGSATVELESFQGSIRLVRP